MNLENLTIAIRPRRDWEAVDLGILMARHWWQPLFRTWLLVTLPFMIPVLFLNTTQLNWYMFFLWLAKPLFERPLLMILSQGVFGTTPSLRQVLKSAPKLMLLQLIPSLTWRRLSPTRSMDLAVIQLEGLRGSERSTRLGILHRQDSGPANWLTIIGLHLETFLALALMSFIALMIPETIKFDIFDGDLWTSKAGTIFWSGLYFFAMACIAPFYVACGFSLYLNRRVKLEGWDLEIAFKRMTQHRGLNANVVVLVALTAIGAHLITKPQIAFAQQVTVQESNVDPLHGEANHNQTQQDELEKRNQFRSTLEAVTAGEPFHVMKTVKVPREQKPEPSPADFAGLSKLFYWLGGLLDVVAVYLELVLWALVIAAIIFVVMRFSRWQNFFAERGFMRKKIYQPSTLFGLEVTKESLPDDINASAMALWHRGDHRGALALLYRASLSRLLNNGLVLHDGATEYECMMLVRKGAALHQVPPPVVEYFNQLTSHWRKLAYGHIEPPEAQAQTLLQTWNQCWMGVHREA